MFRRRPILKFPMFSVRNVSRVLMVAVLGLLPASCNRAGPRAPSEPEPPESAPVCRAELRSWVIAGRGRHMFLAIDCPPPRSDLSGVVEFANTAMRHDFDWTIDPIGAARIARMEVNERVRPAFGEPDNRLEATYELTIKQAACLQRDRVFEMPYFLLGPNSNSSMRAVCEACSVELPDHVLGGAGLFGEFPGVERSPGKEIPHQRWPDLGWASDDPRAVRRSAR